MPKPNDIESLIEEWIPEILSAFYESIRAIRASVPLGIVAKLAEEGRIEDAVAAIDTRPAVFRPYEKAVADAFEDAGNATAKRIPKVKSETTGAETSVTFDARNPVAEGWLRARSSKQIAEILEDQRATIREALADGQERGLNPLTVARDLAGKINPRTGFREGGLIGLTSSQAEWVRNYRAELDDLDPNALQRGLRDARYDRTVSKAIESGKALTVEQKDKMVTAYKNRALKFRADTIARTEMLTGLHVAQSETFRQAIERGDVDPETVVKVWRSAHDKKVRNSHRALDGDSVGYQETFLSPSGARLKFPGDPDAPASETIQCRCYMEMNIDFLRGLEAQGRRARELAKAKAEKKAPKTPLEEIVKQPEPEPVLPPEPPAALKPIAFETSGRGVEEHARLMKATYEEKTPSAVKTILQKDGMTIHSAEKTETYDAKLAKMQPSGYAPGMDFNTSPGFYTSSIKTTVVNLKTSTPWAKDFYGNVPFVEVPEARRVHTLHHETGHALDFALGRARADIDPLVRAGKVSHTQASGYYRPINTPEYVAAYRLDKGELVNRPLQEELERYLRPRTLAEKALLRRKVEDEVKGKLGYFMQQGERGLEEAFAESYASIVGGGDPRDMKKNFPRVYAYIEKLLKDLENG